MGGGGVLRKYKSMKKMSLLDSVRVYYHPMNINNLYFVPVQQNKVYIICINPLHSHATKKMCTNQLTSVQGSYPDPAYVCSLYSVQVYYTPMQ